MGGVGSVFLITSKRKNTTEELNKKRVVQTVADGRLSAACASFLCDALTEPTAENLAKYSRLAAIEQDLSSNFIDPFLS